MTVPNTKGRTAFAAALGKHLLSLQFTHPEYSWLKNMNSKEYAEFFVNFLDGLPTGMSSKDVLAVKMACKELGIKNTYKAIREYMERD